VPTYEYRCKECGDELEVVQSFTDDALTTCALCGGPLRKVFGNVGIAFKGSGFYKNDSRGKSSTAAAATTTGDSTPATPSTSDNGSTSSDGGTSSPESGTKAAPKTPEPKPAKKASTDSTSSS